MKKRLAIVLILIVMLSYVIVVGFFSYNSITKRNPFLNEKISSKDIEYLYNLYIKRNPLKKGKLIYGNENASVSIIAFLDPTSDDSKYFLKKVFPSIKKEFIDTGKIKYYHKNYLTFKDIREGTDRFIYSAALYCIGAKENYIDMFDEFDDIKEFKSKYNILGECLNNNDLMLNSIEVENFRLVTGQTFYISVEGADTKIITGVPQYTRFRRIIKNRELAIGN